MLSFPTRSELIPEAPAKPKPGEAIVSVGVPPVTAEARLDGMANGARDPFVFPVAFGNRIYYSSQLNAYYYRLCDLAT